MPPRKLTSKVSPELLFLVSDVTFSHMMSQRANKRSSTGSQASRQTRAKATKSKRPRQLVITPSENTLSDPVLRATYNSIIDVGVRRTTLADVARRAGVSRMTVYRNYDDLPRLVSALLTVELADLLDEAITRNLDQPTARERLAHTATDTCAALSAHPIMERVLAVDPEAILPLIVDRLGSTQRRAIELVEQMIISGQSEDGDGSIRTGDSSLMALTVIITAQSFVFSHRAISAVDPLSRVYPELAVMLDGYLRAVS